MIIRPGRTIWGLALVVFAVILRTSYAPPVDQPKPTGVPESSTGEDTAEQMAYNLEYERYLQEVVQLLESDPEFKAKLEKASPDDVKSGKIAEELDFLHHDVRTKLDEIKRRELDRLRDALREKAERENGIHELVIPGHVDHQAETFEKEDLRKLVIQATKDLEELDKKRQEEFKEYEMKKEIEFRQSLVNMTEDERSKAIQHKNESEKKHNEHPDVVHPGSKQQLEEVWNKVDNLPKEAFDPNTFFQLHDLTGDGFLDTGELEALFQKELDKVYDKNNPDDDMRERDEEMARMREHVMREWDHNKDGLIAREEFLQDAKTKEFEQNPGWETLDQKKKVYSEEDLKAFAEQWARANGIPVQELYAQYGQGNAYQFHQVPQYPMPNQQYPNQQYPNQVPPYNPNQQQYPNQQQQYPPQYQQQQQWPAQQQQQWGQQQPPQQWQGQPPQGQQQPPPYQQGQQQPPVQQQQVHQPVGQPIQQQQQQPPIQQQQVPVQQNQQQPPVNQQQQPPPPAQQLQNQPPPPPQGQQQQQQPPVVASNQQLTAGVQAPAPAGQPPVPVQGQVPPASQGQQPLQPAPPAPAGDNQVHH